MRVLKDLWKDKTLNLELVVTSSGVVGYCEDGKCTLAVENVEVFEEHGWNMGIVRGAVKNAVNVKRKQRSSMTQISLEGLSK